MPPANPQASKELYRYLGAAPAPLLPRVVAALVDLALLGVVAAVDFLALGMMMLAEAQEQAASDNPPPLGAARLSFTQIAVVVAPVVLFWLWNRVVRVSRGGSSVGMGWAGIRLVAVRSGTSPSADAALVRELLGLLLLAPLGLGLLSTLLSADRRGLHDRASGIAVIQPPA